MQWGIRYLQKKFILCTVEDILIGIFMTILRLYRACYLKRKPTTITNKGGKIKLGGGSPSS
jgi:hypothetical protein